jgi:ABC-type lipoprotein release transport system permease subunit
VLEARPVYSYLSSQFYGTPTSTSEMVFGFGAAMLLCVLATVIPIAIAKRRLEAVER